MPQGGKLAEQQNERLPLGLVQQLVGLLFELQGQLVAQKRSDQEHA